MKRLTKRGIYSSIIKDTEQQLRLISFGQIGKTGLYAIFQTNTFSLRKLECVINRKPHSECSNSLKGDTIQKPRVCKKALLESRWDINVIRQWRGDGG